MNINLNSAVHFLRYFQSNILEIFNLYITTLTSERKKLVIFISTSKIKEGY